jgi:hypothetical protein
MFLVLIMVVVAALFAGAIHRRLGGADRPGVQPAVIGGPSPAPSPLPKPGPAPPARAP